MTRKLSLAVAVMMSRELEDSVIEVKSTLGRTGQPALALTLIISITYTMSNQFTTANLNDAAQTGGFAALSSPSSHAGGAATAASEQTPIAPSTFNALDKAATPSSSSQTHTTTTTTGSGATHTKYSEPNIPAAAQDLASKAPSGEEIQQKSHQYIDQAAQLAAQAKTQAGQLVAPKDKEELNSAEASLDSVTRGIAGSELALLCSAV